MRTAEYESPEPAAAIRGEAIAQLRDAASKSATDPDGAMEQIRMLFGSDDANIRGLARKVMAELVLSSANRRATGLFHEACDHLQYQPDSLVKRTVEAARLIGDFGRVYELCMASAEHRVLRREWTPALAALFDAVTTDIGHGAVNVNDPMQIRRMVRIYKRCSGPSREAVAIRSVARGQRRTRSDVRLRLAHVVCQLVDGGHAPSRSIQTMLRCADTERFDHYLVVTESLVPHAEHADSMFRSDPSTTRAPNLIRHFENDLNVPVLRPRSFQSYVHSAADLHEQMVQQKIDVAFFHGSIALPTEWLLCDWRCAPWQADAGFGVPLHCPAVDLQFFELEETMEALAFQCRACNIPYAAKRSGADMSEVTEAAPYARNELGASDNHVLLGVIGNHLQKRMGEDFCRAIGNVLRQRPQALLYIVGPGEFGRHAAWLGSDLCGGQTPRIRFCGSIPSTARHVQTFDIHLNPFPDGGGFTVGDAMAAGKPVVSICQGDSLYAAAGRTWLGEENLVRPATADAYSTALLKLIDSVDERATFGAKLRARFEERFDARRWVRYMGDQIWKVVHATEPLSGRIDVEPAAAAT